VEQERFTRTAVIGTGMMGPGIALALAQASERVAIVGRSAASLVRGRERLASVLSFLVRNGLRDQAEADALGARVWLTKSMDDGVAGAGLVVESIAEDLQAKQRMFDQLERLCGPEALLTTNTSGFRISEIAALLRHPERTATTHFWNPPHVMPLVEITQGERTSAETVQSLVMLLRRCGKTPVVARKDVPGQIANRLQHALMREALYIVQEGIASAGDVDLALKLGPGRRWPVYGVLDHSDFVGAELSWAVQRALLPGLCRSTTPLPILEGMVADGHLGVATGQGFHDWRQRDAAAVQERRDAFLVMMARDWPELESGGEP
jgi:3-hydroxybutyryl-CoA dehydrogenase